MGKITYTALKGEATKPDGEVFYFTEMTVEIERRDILDELGVMVHSKSTGKMNVSFK